jgi:epoxyqueuosine reductase QueG
VPGGRVVRTGRGQPGPPRPAGEREHAQSALPGTRTLIAMAVRMNRDNCRSPARSVANQEFHQADEQANHAARSVTQALQDTGYRALNPSVGFPQEMDHFPSERIWVVAHKTVTVAAGLGVMGLHRNVIHPEFGSFILLVTVLVDAEVSEYGQALDYTPCTNCKLCVAWPARSAPSPRTAPSTHWPAPRTTTASS